MGFLKRIFGRNKWEQVADEVDTANAVWESVPYVDPTPSMGASQSPPQVQPGAAASPPPPKFQPGGMQVGAAAGADPLAPPPKFQAGAMPAPRFRPGVTPAAVAEPTPAPESASEPEPVPESEPESEPESVPSIAKPAMMSMSRSPEPTKEIILDTIDEDDENMPEEFRGCRVVERTSPDGTVAIVYRGPDGFAVDEGAADFLIASYKEELATLTPKTAQPHPSGVYAAPAQVQPVAVEPRLMGVTAQPAGQAPLADEIIDELGFGEDLPPQMRGARFVRRGGAFEYVTQEGSRLSKDEAENQMEQWERSLADQADAAPLVIDELGIGNDLPPELRGAKFINDGNEFLYVTREGTHYSKDMAEGMMERWERDEVERSQASLKVSMPQPEVQTPWASSPSQPAAAPLAVTAEPSEIQPRAEPPAAESPAAESPAAELPVAEPEMVGATIGDVLKMRAESGLLSVAPMLEPEPPLQPPPRTAKPAPTPAPAFTPAPRQAEPTPRAPTPVPIGVDPRFPVRAVTEPQPGDVLEDPTTEVRIDGAALAAAQQAAELIRSRVLDDEDAAYKSGTSNSRLQQACQSEIDRKRTRHRFEHMLELSAQAREALQAAWSKSSDRKHRDAAKDLDQDMLLLGLFNPMTMREIDLPEFLSVSRLRSSERRRTIVTGELARRVNEQSTGDMHQYCMTRAFVDQVAQAAMGVTDPPEKILEQVLTARLKASVEGVVTEITKRHGIWLPGLADRLATRLAPLVRGLIKLSES
jgi:hypothetical protein